MSKKTRYENYRAVAITPLPRSARFKNDHRLMLSDTQKLADQINRHCDAEGKAEVEFDIVHECDVCGAPWTEISDKFNGGCCDYDIEYGIKEKLI